MPSPSALSTTPPKASELDRARIHYGKRPAPKKAYPFKAYKSDEVKRRLEELFHGKCAYCESRYDHNSPVDVEHFRPKGGVEGDPTHPGYWWLAMDWDNLLPSCIDCNRRRNQPSPIPGANLSALDLASRLPTGFAIVQTGKHNAFPIGGRRAQPESMALAAEEPLLLNPCRDNPAEHLDFQTTRPNLVALALPQADRNILGQLSVRGAVSIQLYGLNRLALVQERTRVLRRLDFLGGLIIDLSALADDADGEPGEFARRVSSRLRTIVGGLLGEVRRMTAPHAPYSALARRWVRTFRSRFQP